MIDVLGIPALNGIMEFDPYLFWRLKKNVRDFHVTGFIRQNRVDFTVNTFNWLRAPKYKSTKNCTRILTLGDSCTFGLGVDDNETWPALLQNLLGSKGIRAEVINAGVPGYTSFQGRRLLQKIGLALEPDMVIACFGFNDKDVWASRSDIETARSLYLNRWESVFIRSRLYYGIKSSIFAKNQVDKAPKSERPRLLPEEYYENLKLINKMCTAKNIKLGFLIWPFEEQVSQGVTKFSGCQKVTAQFCSDENLISVNLLQEFINIRQQLFLDHIHANNEGNRVVAEAVFHTIIMPFMSITEN